MLQPTLQARLSQFSQAPNAPLLQSLQRGIEREGLRIKSDGSLSERLHPEVLGATLTHPHITTDYAETLLEFITPVAKSIRQTLNQLRDIHNVTYQALGDEMIWPLSMPCYVGDEADILIAQYGSSHGGRMKNLYRKGLTKRYGGVMQIIAGVHFNFSVPRDFWDVLAQGQQQQADQDFISAGYFGLIRNYKRISWMIPYLFGASPAICQSFLRYTDTQIEFEKHGKGTIYRKYGTSLRMSDLGYTNKEQAALGITYNSVDEYVAGLRRAISTKSESFADFGVKNGEDYIQLNANILQIENEFYSSIRPKRTAKSGETPTQALERGGVEYIEVRALDVNPFSPVGITAEQIRLLDILLLWCLLSPSPTMNKSEQQEADQNFNKVVLDGRNPYLALQYNGESRAIADWLEDMFADLHDIAKVLDAASDTPDDSYQATVAEQYKAVLNPELTLSGQVMHMLQSEQLDISELGLRLAKRYQQELSGAELLEFSSEQFATWATASIAEQKAREHADATSSFDDYLADYFRRAQCASPDCCK